MKNDSVIYKAVFTGLLFSMVACSNGGSTTTTSDTTDSIKKETAPASPAPDTSLAGRWVLQPALASDTAAGKTPEISFLTEEARFTGNNGCNNMSGRYSRHADTLVFDERILSTKMACLGYNEKPFMDNLIRTNRFKVQNGVLTLLNNETVLSTWTRYTEKPGVEKI